MPRPRDERPIPTRRVPARGELGTMVGIVWRTHRRGILVWVLALAASMIGTAAAVAGLYDTPAKIHTYAEAVTSGSALAAINGHVEGIDSLGGVIQDEFGFLASFLLPLLGIGLIAGSTRREEESGRLETILGGRIARHQPVLAALAVATAAILVTSVLFAAGLALSGVPVSGAILYSAALGALAFVFAGFAALLAQLVLHARGVYTWSLIVLAAAYVLRGVGDTTTSWLTWLSPLGWAEKTAPFADQRWWVLAIPAVAGLASGGAAVWLAARRDVGSALLRGGAGPARATRLRRRPIGFAVWIHRPATAGWLAGGILLTAMMGSLAQQFLDAMAGNPALGDAMGIERRPAAGRLRRRDPALPGRHRRRVRHPGDRHPPSRGGRGSPGDPTRRHAVPGPLAGRPQRRRRGRAGAHRRRLVVGPRAVDRVVGREHRRIRR